MKIFLSFPLWVRKKFYLQDICSGKSEGFAVRIICSVLVVSSLNRLAFEEHSGRPDKGMYARGNDMCSFKCNYSRKIRLIVLKNFSAARVNIVHSVFGVLCNR